MFRNYLITALRNVTRHKLYSFINIAGLTVGLACAIFIILFVRDELSYDKWIPGTENLYRVEGTFHPPGIAPVRWSVAPFPVADAMLAHIPEVKAAVHLDQPNRMTVTSGNRQFLDPIDVVSSNFFQVIQLPLVSGSAATVFTQPESVVISQRAAQKYFGTQAALGRTLRVGGICEYGTRQEGCVTREANMTVTGVMRNLPHNTQLTGDVFIPNNSAANPMGELVKESWFGANGWDYVLLAPNANLEAVTAKLVALVDRSVDTKRIGFSGLKGSGWWMPMLAPFRDDHLSTDQFTSLVPAGSWTTVYGFAAIGVLILLIACFNFTNLATARAMMRAREISMRKVVGARRGQLVVQFLSESVLMALLSLVLAVTLVEVLLPLYDRVLGKPIELRLVGDWLFLLALVAAAVLVGLIAGFYPALVLSRFRPASTLKTNASGQSGSGRLRAALVVVQFAVSIGLGITALVVFQQISFARTMNIGMDKDGIVVINADSMSPSTLESFVRALDANPLLGGAARSADIPFSGQINTDTVQLPGQAGSTTLRVTAIDPDFLSVYRIRLLSGRSLSRLRADDAMNRNSTHYNVLINAAAARQFGYSPRAAVGKTFFEVNSANKVAPRTALTIVGVTTDFKFKSDKEEVVPTFYVNVSGDMNWVSVRVPARGISRALSAIDDTWRAFAPSAAIDRHFVDEDFEKQFSADEQQGRIFAIFVGVAIFIACLGLFGLAAFSTERRTKEIGIRKTFGARTKDIVLMLLWQFSIPVLIANIIAWPAAYYYLHGWLESYAYRISLNPLYFLGAGLAALLIAWATVIVHAAHVARANPVHALRYE
jgi:putative ABC transport system permease protein